VRLFVALDIPEAVREVLTGLRMRFEKICRGARWVRLEGVHITLKFIGEVPAGRVDAIRAALQNARATAPIDLRFVGLGFFPNERHPRVFWAGIEAGAALAQLAAAVEAQLSPLGFPPEKREFRPHLTLARFDSAEGVDQLRAAAAEFAATEFGRSAPREFYLYQSVLKREGAEYTRLASYSLPSEHGS
jgi:RNA 2',3'-cyclic 3'-phosphodiesterase